MNNKRFCSILTVLLAFAALSVVSNVYAQQTVTKNDTSGAYDDTAFINRTEKAYREAILKAPNDATIDAFVCQQLVQKMREQGMNYPDEKFQDILDSKETLIERQKLIEYWKQERKKAEEQKKEGPVLKFGAAAGAVLLVLIVVMAIGGRKKDAESVEGKKDEQQQNA